MNTENMSMQINNIMSIMTSFVKETINTKKPKDVSTYAMELANKILPELIAIARTESFASDAGIKRGRGRPKGVKAEPTVKRARTAYILFCGEKRAELTGTKDKKGKELTGKEITAILGDMWKKADNKTKSKYNDLAKKDKERYENEMKDAPPVEKPFYTPFNYFKKMKKDEIAKEEGIKGKELNARLSELWKGLDRKEKSDYKTKSILYKPTEEEKNGKSKKGGKKEKKPAKPTKYTGYLVFCQQRRKELKEEYDAKLEASKKTKKDIEKYSRTSAEITKELGALWKGLSAEEKAKYNKQADALTKKAKKEFEDANKKDIDDEESEAEDNDDESEEENDDDDAEESESENDEDDAEESEEEEEEEVKEEVKPKKRVLPSSFKKAVAKDSDDESEAEEEVKPKKRVLPSIFSKKAPVAKESDDESEDEEEVKPKRKLSFGKK